jgi:glycosyltransferase involved in cell wall biosynthesis
MTQQARSLGKVITVNTSDVGGGAERMAWTLFKGFEARGLESWLVVGDKKTDDPRVMPFYLSPHINYGPYGRPWSQPLLRWRKRLDRALGLEDFRHPYSKYLPTITGPRPDVVHCHNLHGGFFDLRVLPRLCRQVPVWLTLHDCWCLTGHCAYPFDCPRWQSGCGACPYLDTPPALARDGTRRNWWRKKGIFERCRLHVAAGSRWLLQRAAQSVLAPAIVESRLIPYGIDLGVYRPAPQAAARRQLGIPLDVHMALFAAHAARSNPFKDYATMRAALARLAGGLSDRDIHFYCVGEAAADERLGRLLIHHIPYQAPERLALYYQAADVYVHAAREEVFGIVIAEAMACGIPVVATAVGGIPEVFVDQQQGLLVPPGDPEQMAQAVAKLLQEPGLRRQLGQQAAKHARSRYNQNTMIDAYLGWFSEGIQANQRAA